MTTIAQAYLGAGSGVAAAEAARLSAATDYASKKQTADNLKVSSVVYCSRMTGGARVEEYSGSGTERLGLRKLLAS